MSIINKINNLRKKICFKHDSLEEKTINLSSIFFLFLWIINPSNKIALLFFLVFLYCLFRLTKKLDISLIIVFFLSSFFSIGKTYFIQLLDLKQFPDLMNLYPIGLVTKVQISISDVLFSFLVVYLILINYKKRINFKKIALIDIILIIFFIYGIFADFFISTNIYLSFLLKKDLFEFIFIYFVIRFFIQNQSLLFRLFFASLIVLTFFEVFIVLQQYIYSSPIGKSVEATFNIEHFGGLPDEQSFIFRPIGTFIHTNVLAMFFASIFPFLTFLIIKSKKYSFKIIFFTTIACLILTLSRVAWLISLISFIFIVTYFKYHKKSISLKNISFRKNYFFIILSIPLFLYSFPRIIQTFNTFQEGGGLNLRVKQINEVLNLITQSPFFGVGTGMSVVKAIEKVPHGVFAGFPSEIHVYPLLIAVENGLPYLAFFVIFLFYSFKKLIRYKKNLPLISFFGLLSMMVIGLFQPFIINNLLFILLAFDYDKISEDSYAY